MATVKFYLREYKDQDGEAQLYWSYNHKGRKTRKPTGIKIRSKYWDQKNQRVLPSSPDFDEQSSIVRNIRAEIEAICNEAIFRKEEPDVDYVKSKLQKDKLKAISFFELFDRFIQDHRNKLSVKRIQSYGTCRKHLERFQKANSIKLSLEKFDLGCFNAFENYLVEKADLSHNTVVTHIKIAKRFLKYTHDLQLHSNTSYLRATIADKNSAIIVLTPEELKKIIKLPLTSERLNRVRDLFLFQVYTGQRFGDIQALRKEDIKGRYWHLFVQKTREENLIPLIEQAFQILEKYDYELPKYSNQKMNSYLKELGKLAELDEPVNMYKWIGNEKIDNYLPKYKVLTTHVARKSFITLSLMNDLQVPLIKDITGHKSYKVFDRYKKLSDSYKLDSLQKAWGSNEEKAK